MLLIPHDLCGELGGKQTFVRDHETGKPDCVLIRFQKASSLTVQLSVNRVAVECWKALRMPETPKRPGPQDLSLFPQMPIDILLEVLGHLHPIDLMHVARADKAFRALLCSSSAEPLWCSAFVGRPPLPTAPPDISARRWAKLLFGARVCDECDAPDINPDYRIWRRLCTECMDKHLFPSPPPYAPSHIVNDLLVKTFRDDGHNQGTGSEDGRLWPSDGAAIVREYERLEADDAQAALDAFIDARKLTVQAIEERAAEAEEWSDKVYNDSIPLWRDRLARTLRSARNRLIEEGHDPQDVENAEDLEQLPCLQYFPRLTSKRWNKARPHILPLVAAARTARLERERQARVTQRTRAVGIAASHVLRTAPAQSWAYVPPQYTITSMPPLRALIHDASEAALADDDARLADALLALPAFVEGWCVEKRALLVSLLPPPAGAGCTSACASDSSDSGVTPATDLGERRLDLATSVFTCLGSWVDRTRITAGRALIGWEGAGPHLRCGSLRSFWEHRVHYAPEGAAAAGALVRLVGLDPERATAAEMDVGRAVERRFVCMLCPAEARRGVHGRRAMRWRECVQHTIERSRMNEGDIAHRNVPPHWAQLTDAAAADVRRLEKPDPVVWDRAWGCALCTAHYGLPVPRAEAVGHLLTEHGIREPTEGRHFVYFVGGERTPREPALLSLEGDVRELRCNRCTGGKLRSVREIGRHVVDKHGVPAPTEADWTRVELLLRTAQYLVGGV
ncbi:hypothetical protein DFH06DRAFT_988156 [Mycena polygramma]|nr:hypothetical protein DFH06DRAFT_988156 [Mycena polygramma]